MECFLKILKPAVIVCCCQTIYSPAFIAIGAKARVRIRQT
jgi:hypothetical protein